MLKNLTTTLEKPVTMRIVVQNFHHETRTTGSGKNRRTRRVRVNTARFEMVFKYERWVDESEPISSLAYLQGMLLTRLSCYKTVDMAPDVRERYVQEVTDFEQGHITDVEHEVIEDEEFLEYCAETLVHNSKDGKLPWFVSPNLLWWLDFINLGWYQRRALV